jgi:precorrin-2/cobalt-factor-2 C20-methyltransferase
MTKDPDFLKPAWEIAFKEIGDRLYAGKSVAFISEGDPFVYSTFIYLYNHAKKNWPDVDIEVVPAVSSLSAVPIVAEMPIADGEERIAVIPASYGIDDLRGILKSFDTILLMKVSSVMPQVVDAIEAEGLLDRAVYVSKATMPQQKIVRDITSIKNDRCDYFSMVVVCKKDRSGILEGKKIKDRSVLGVET